MKKMSNFKKIIYALALGIFFGKITTELYFDYTSSYILWPVIGMMWCITALINEKKR
jgi:hypothetical protein